MPKIETFWIQINFAVYCLNTFASHRGLLFRYGEQSPFQKLALVLPIFFCFFVSSFRFAVWLWFFFVYLICYASQFVDWQWHECYGDTATVKSSYWSETNDYADPKETEQSGEEA